MNPGVVLSILQEQLASASDFLQAGGGYLMEADKPPGCELALIPVERGLSAMSDFDLWLWGGGRLLHRLAGFAEGLTKVRSCQYLCNRDCEASETAF